MAHIHSRCENTSAAVMSRFRNDDGNMDVVTTSSPHRHHRGCPRHPKGRWLTVTSTQRPDRLLNRSFGGHKQGFHSGVPGSVSDTVKQSYRYYRYLTRPVAIDSGL
jgi:hypothetical protein